MGPRHRAKSRPGRVAEVLALQTYEGRRRGVVVWVSSNPKRSASCSRYRLHTRPNGRNTRATSWKTNRRSGKEATSESRSKPNRLLQRASIRPTAGTPGKARQGAEEPGGDTPQDVVQHVVAHLVPHHEEDLVRVELCQERVPEHIRLVSRKPVT